MKMVKSLLLGTAAGLVAIAGAQAADLPVKANPVQYVKICSLYGAGFYYIPGTDMCLKIGGWIRQYLAVNALSTTNGALAGNLNTRAQNNGFTWKVRGYITADARNQSEYGTVRGYISIGTSIQGTNGGQGAAGAGGVSTGGFNANRAFIQWAGFTFGVSQSFYDIYPTPALSYWGGMANPSSDTSDGGQTVTAYTAQFGNGFSASLAAEAPRSNNVIGDRFGTANLSTINLAGVVAGQQNISTRYPDVVGNLRVDQAWGSAAVMGAIHDASGLYYGPNTDFGKPNDAMGWVAGAGIKLLAPMIAPGDYFSAQVNYANGATGYPIDGSTTPAPSGGAASLGYGSYGAVHGGTGGSFGIGVVSDSVYGVLGGVGTDIQLTTTWGVNAGYEHFWNKRWQTSVYGAYTATSYNATANAVLCRIEGGHGAVSGTIGPEMTVANGCNNNWAYWAVGTRTQFNIDSQTYMGLDVIYTDLKSATNNVAINTVGSGAQPNALRTIGDQSAWMAEFRMHRNFYP